jgi:hypothetical protein
MWSVRYQIKPDGVSYIDMARAISAGDWKTAVNSTWSPAYPATIAALLKFAKSSSSLGVSWVAAHIANLFFYLLALLAFDLFWRELGTPQDAENPTLASITEFIWIALGFTLFAVTFVPILDVITPDLGVAAVVFATGFFLRRWVRSEVSLLQALLFGAILGVGYWIKAVLFPLGIIVILMLGGWELYRRTHVWRFGSLVAAFMVVVSPLIIVVSRTEHHLTFSESGRLVYAWNVNGVTFDENSKIPIGSRQLSHPATYVTPLRLGVTYAPWYDPAVYGKDIKGKFHLGQQLGVLYRNYKVLRDTFFLQFGALTFTALLLLLVCRKGIISQAWAVAFYASSALGLYSAVLIETRYIGPFLLLLWAVFLGNIIVPKELHIQRIARTSMVLATVVVGYLALPSLVSFCDVRTMPSLQLEIARQIGAEGVKPEDRVAVVGDGIWQMWPQPLRASISAEIPDRQAVMFWTEPDRQREALSVFRNTGAKLAVGKPPLGIVPKDWVCSRSTGYCSFDLRQAGEDLSPAASISPPR